MKRPLCSRLLARALVFLCWGGINGQTAKTASGGSVGVLLPSIDLPFHAIDLPVELLPEARSEIIAYMRYITVTEAPILQSFWVESLRRQGISAVALNGSTPQSVHTQAEALHVKALLASTVTAHNVDYSNVEMMLGSVVLNGAAMAGSFVPGGQVAMAHVEPVALNKLIQMARDHASHRTLRVKYSLSGIDDAAVPPPVLTTSHASNDTAVDLWGLCLDDISQTIIGQNPDIATTPISIYFAAEAGGVGFTVSTHRTTLIRGKSIEQLLPPAVGSNPSRLPKNSEMAKMVNDAHEQMDSQANRQMQVQFSPSTIIGEDGNQRALLSVDSDRVYVLNPEKRSFFTMSTAEAKVAFAAISGGLQPVELIPTSSMNASAFTYDVKIAPGVQLDDNSLQTGSQASDTDPQASGPDCTVNPPGLTPKQVDQYHSACEKTRKMQSGQHRSEDRGAEKNPSTVEIQFGPPNPDWLNALQSFRHAELSPFISQTVQFGSDPYLSGAIWHEVIAHGAPPTHVHISTGNSRGMNEVTDISWSPVEPAPGAAVVPADWKQRANPQLDILFGSPVEPLAWRIFNAAMKIAAKAGYMIP